MFSVIKASFQGEIFFFQDLGLLGKCELHSLLIHLDYLFLE